MKKMKLDLCLEEKKIKVSATTHCLRTEVEETAWSQCPLLTTRRQLMLNLKFERVCRNLCATNCKPALTFFEVENAEREKLCCLTEHVGK